MADLFPGVEPERLRRRIEFLQSRAEVHLASSEDTLHRACAATQLRDAGCVALLIGEMTEARHHLRRAGHLFLHLGLAAGSTLIALAGTRTARQEVMEYQDVIDSVSRQWDRERARERDAPTRPLAEMSRGAPRQMFSLMQAEWLTRTTPNAFLLDDDLAMRRALERNGGHPVGSTGLSMETYSRMAEWMLQQRQSRVESKSRDESMPEFVVRGFATVASTRAEYIRAAMHDSYHWRLIARPAELLDLDTVVLSSIALGVGMNPGAIEQFFSSDITLESAPIVAATRLRNDQAL
jgi:hypothetical protein